MAKVSPSSFRNTTAFDAQHSPTTAPSVNPSRLPHSADAQESSITVTLLLSGGHKYGLILPAESPWLRQLFTLFLEAPEQRAKRLFQFLVHPLNAKQDARQDAEQEEPEAAALCFTGDRLVGILTDPPVYIPQHDAPLVGETLIQGKSQGMARVSSQKEGSAIATATAADKTPPSAGRYTVVTSPEREQSLAEDVMPSR
ncbi:MAG: hypothetical protein F6K09_12900, partial [Merismopedia sp. SIO2A8]|nr:hypothetical protein [Merismopedia sp. SIO2A8]